MATSLSSFQTTPSIVCSAASHKPDPNRRNPAASQSNNWWAPLFGWSSDPDYISAGVKIETSPEVLAQPENGSGRAKAENNLFRGCFTEEKAKELRKKTRESSTFHDVFYHSAIASRLASDVSGRADG